MSLRKFARVALTAYVSQVAIDGISKPKPNYPEGVEASMIKNTFTTSKTFRIFH